MPKIVDHDQRRSEIAQALWQVIHERGIEGVSFRAVAEAAGVSVGRVQHYFTDKESLIHHGCRHMVAAAENAYGPDLDDPDPGRARAALLNLLCAPVPSREDFRKGAAVWAAYQARAVSDPGIAETVVDATAGRRRALAALLTTARGHGRDNECSERRTGADALLLAALSEGLAQRVLVGELPAEEAIGLIRAEVDRLLPHRAADG